MKDDETATSESTDKIPTPQVHPTTHKQRQIDERRRREAEERLRSDDALIVDHPYDASSNRIRDWLARDLRQSLVVDTARAHNGRSVGFARDIDALRGDQGEIAEDLTIALFKTIAREHPQVLRQVVDEFLRDAPPTILASRSFRTLLRLALNIQERHPDVDDSSSPPPLSPEEARNAAQIRSLQASRRKAIVRLTQVQSRKRKALEEYRRAERQQRDAQEIEASTLAELRDIDERLEVLLDRRHRRQVEAPQEKDLNS